MDDSKRSSTPPGDDTEQRWERIEEIFGCAIELDEIERASFLARACGEDSQLRIAVEGLLFSDQAATDFLESSPPLTTSPTPSHGPGDRLGPYRLLELLGQGGMGTVYLAERADGAFSGRVAVKVLRHGTESPGAIERLERERQILAGLDHPGIARLVDGGSTLGGLPWVAMEYVDGEPIDRACERGGWEVDEQIEHILAICDALETAHRNLVVHRDLKPSNILVDREGRPHLLDFGIAKLLESGDSGTDAEPTATWDRRLTPSYASPEQLRGDRISLATDVYQLGVVLYRLLTGELPHQLAGLSLQQIETKLLEHAPRPPSEVVREAAQRDSERPIRRLDSDLDHIVLKALRPEPTRRYGTIAELAADLRRFREGRPVEARQGNRRYRMAKAIRRHWVPLATVSLFVLLLATFATFSTLQSIRLERSLERRLAMEGMLADLFRMGSAEGSAGRVPTLDEVLSRGEAQLAVGTVTEPGTRGLLHALFGRLASSLGESARARYHLERGLADFASLGHEDSLRLAAARARGDLALVALQEGDGAAAEALATDALTMGREAARDDPLRSIELLNPLLIVYCRLGKWERAAPLSAEAMALSNASHDRPSPQRALALTQRALVLKNHEQDLEGSRRLYREALAMYRSLGEDDHPEVAVIHNQLGLLARRAEDLALALDHLEAALVIRRRLYPEGHWEIGQSLYQLASIYRRAGDLAAAEHRMAEAVTIYQNDPDRGPAFNRTVFLLLHLAEIRIEHGRSCEIEAMLYEQIPTEWWLRQRDHWLLAWAEGVLGCALADQGRKAEGETLLALGLERLRRQGEARSREIEFLSGCLTDQAIE